MFQCACCEDTGYTGHGRGSFCDCPAGMQRRSFQAAMAMNGAEMALDEATARRKEQSDGQPTEDAGRA